MRPHEQEQWSKKQLYLAYCLAQLIGAAIVIGLMVIAGFVLVNRLRAEPSVCQTIVDWTFQYDVQYPEWIGYPAGWEGVEGFENAEMIILPFPDEAGGYVIYRLPDGSDVIIPHWSWERRTDSEGLHFGTHDLCPVMRWLAP